MDEVRMIDAELLTVNIAQIAKNCARSDAQKALIGRILFMIENMPTIEVEPDNGWISVKDRLPDDNVDVLLHDTYCGTLMGWYDKQDGIFKSDYISRLDAVTRWIPLPEEPKGE